MSRAHQVQCGRHRLSDQEQTGQHAAVRHVPHHCDGERVQLHSRVIRHQTRVQVPVRREHHQRLARSQIC